MTSIKNITAFLFIALLCFTSCKKWLDVNPKTNISQRVLFEDEQGFKDALTGAYVQMASPSLYAKELTMGMMDVLAQNYNVSATTHSYYQAGRYNYEDGATRSKIDGFWRNSYSVIANLNNMLEAIDAKRDVFTGNNYAIIKGEALAMRAFLHFDLLRNFGPVPAMGLNQKAIPYVTTFSMEVRPFLSGNQVIDLCLADLKQAVELLSVNKGVNSGVADPFLSFTRNHLNYWAANGLMARIYLYKGDLAEAYAKAKLIISNTTLFPFVSRDVLAGSAPSRTFVSEHLFGIYVPNLQEINAGLFRSSSTPSVLTNDEGFISRRFEASSTDYRSVFLWKTDGSTNQKYPVKYWQDDIVSNGTLIKRIPLIRLSEMYYIAAEATNIPAERITFLNSIRKNRGLSDLPATTADNLMDAEIFKEYKKEFYQEGQLFYYYKRKNILRIEGYALDMSPATYVLPVPNDEIEFNNK